MADDRPGPRPLNPFGDVTVSKGFARREHAGTVDAFPLLSELAGSVARPVDDTFDKRRRLTPAQISATAGSFERRLDALAETVSRYDAHTPATKARPRGAMHRKGRLCVSRDQNDFRLVAASLDLTSKRISLDVSPTVVGWTRHAAERYYERTGRAGTAAGPVIGRTLANQFLIVSIAIESVHARKGFCDLAIPAGDGLLLGQVHEVPRAAWDGGFVLLDGRGVSGGRSQPASGMPVVADPDHVACWRAMTYVGPDEMGTGRRAYAETWNAVARQNRMADDNHSGGCLVANRNHAPEAVAELHTHLANFRLWIDAFLDAPENATLTRRTPYPPPLLPQPAWDHVREGKAVVERLMGAGHVGKWRDW